MPIKGLTDNIDPKLPIHKVLLCDEILYEGPRVTKQAKVWDIHDSETGERKNTSLILERKEHDKDSTKITLVNNDGESSLSALIDCLRDVPFIRDALGDFAANPINVNEQLQQTLNALSGSEENQHLMSQILEWVAGDARAKAGLTRLAASREARSLVAAMNHERHSQTLDEFRELVEDNLEEHHYQDFLADNRWIFGSEYSELTRKRQISDDARVDYLLRRTADGYQEIIEIKRPFKDNLFRKRGSGKGLSEIKAVVDAVSQADDYLSILDAEQHALFSKSNGTLKVEKARAKVIIGRSGNDNDQTAALHKMNARYHRIEVMTYDQLIAIAQKMLDMLADENSITN